MKLSTTSFVSQSAFWPTSGRHILASFDKSSIIVYQAYRQSIAKYAIENQKFGGTDFSLARMSWIKPNFLWMMYRSGWGTKEGQEFTLGLRVSTSFFESILEQAVPSTFDERLFPNHVSWKRAVAESEVRMQWDPDHSPSGEKLERRAIQLGLRGSILRKFSESELLEVINMSEFVESQRAKAHLSTNAQLLTPVERVYIPVSVLARERLKLSHDA